MAFDRALENAPGGLFKFRAYDRPDRREWVKQLFSGYAYFPTLAEFNDPFEGRMVFTETDHGTFRSRLWKRLQRIAANRGIELPKEVPDVDPTNFAQHISKQHQQRMRTEARFFCFCATRDHPLLWSHYANSHRGICIHFGCRTHPFGHSLRVAYDDAFPKMEVVEVCSLKRRKTACFALDAVLHWRKVHIFAPSAARTTAPEL